MSAINPASFASPTLGLQAPSGIGPGAVGVGRSSSTTDRRQNQSQQQQQQENQQAAAAAFSPSVQLARGGFPSAFPGPFGTPVEQAPPPTAAAPAYSPAAAPAAYAPYAAYSAFGNAAAALAGRGGGGGPPAGLQGYMPGMMAAAAAAAAGGSPGLQGLDHHHHHHHQQYSAHHHASGPASGGGGAFAGAPSPVEYGNMAAVRQAAAARFPSQQGGVAVGAPMAQTLHDHHQQQGMSPLNAQADWVAGFQGLSLNSR